MLEKNYAKVVTIFEGNLNNFTAANSNSKASKHTKVNLVPYDQLGLAFEALLLIVNYQSEFNSFKIHCQDFLFSFLFRIQWIRLIE